MQAGVENLIGVWIFYMGAKHWYSNEAVVPSFIATRHPAFVMY